MEVKFKYLNAQNLLLVSYQETTINAALSTCRIHLQFIDHNPSKMLFYRQWSAAYKY